MGAMPSQSEESSPRAEIRVGVTGHRAEGLSRAGYVSEVLSQSVREVLTQVKQIAEAAIAEPLLCVISPLAEGADRIVAEEALALGYSLQSPLPFPRYEYERDFATSVSKAAFDALLNRASEVVELAGSRAAANQAYEAVGRWVLLHSDVLIAIWDGKPPAGQGGTGQIIAEALTKHITTIWIQPAHEITILKNLRPIVVDTLHNIDRQLGEILKDKISRGSLRRRGA